MGPQPEGAPETIIYVIRHGETLWNRERRFQGQADAPLSELGRRQAQVTAAYLAQSKLSAIYASDLSRARDTAETIARATGVSPVVLDAALREARFGVWEGKTVEEVYAAYPREAALWRADSVNYRPEGGERLEEVYERSLGLFRRLIVACPGGEVAIVTHGGPIKSLVCYALGAPLSAFRHIQLDNCSITTLRHTTPDGILAVLGLNDRCHLSGPL